jgi:hypothetical protein
MLLWAKNKLTREPAGVVELTPSAVIELADILGCSDVALSNYLARFITDGFEGLPALDNRSDHLPEVSTWRLSDRVVRVGRVRG